MSTTRSTVKNFEDGREAIAIVGLGYVGLPLAVAFSKRFRVIGFDVNEARVSQLLTGVDSTGEVAQPDLLAVQKAASEGGKSGLRFSTSADVLAEANIIIVTVPTPIDAHKNPDLRPLVSASRSIGKHIKPGTTVVYESTVYPGCTEEDCVPVVESVSGLRSGVDFFVGYSPERINPGDRLHTVEKIKKVVSGDNPETAQLLADVYGAVITAGVYKAANIKTAEAAKVIENTQRDVNIALMNELALIFNRMGLNTLDVLEASATKWNFLPFRPGLVGGHCIGVDPYYLTFKAQSLGHHCEVILAGRRINDNMGKFVAEQTVKKLITEGRRVKGGKALILGWTFKEDVPDIRNSRVIDIYAELVSFGLQVVIHDPMACPDEVKHEYGVELESNPEQAGPYEVVVLAVKHASLVRDYTLDRLCTLGGEQPPVLIDVKGFFNRRVVQERGLSHWQL